ncbi:MAG: putative AAA+ superfamily ATPase [Neolewinella sp.]|jgi:predicted AAA+ superfamily ATPase
MIFQRRLTKHLAELRKYFPIISLTGPRQSGKTTLLRSHFNDFRYVNFELPRERLAFEEDPVGFLKTYNDYVIFDEAQHVPDLFSYLQVNVDEDRRPGRFILSGSQDFLLRKSINQSLAGRVGIARLLPYDFEELRQNGEYPQDQLETIFNGFYPGRLKDQLPPHLFYGSYLYSYVQRDVAGFINPSNLGLFNRFIEAVAGSVGQLTNYSNLATLVGVDVKTIQSWISILEQSYIIFRLPPYFKSISRRLVKSPKLYFYDTGLLCYLLGIREPAELRSFHLYGNVFENLIVSDAFKSAYHSGDRPLYHFYRDRKGKEIDLLYETPAKKSLWEIKATETFHPRLIRPLNKIADDVFPDSARHLIYGGADEMTLNSVRQVPWNKLKW